MDYKETIPSKLRGVRSEFRMTQKEVAEKLNCNEVTVVNWEKEEGATTPSFDKACALADLYGVSLDTLAGRDGRGVKAEG